MQWRNNERAYGLLSVTMHWLMLVLLIAVYACIELRVLFPKDSPPREAIKDWHFMLGLTVWMLVWLRLAFRLWAPTPAIVPALPAAQRLAAGALHLALYALMLGMPLLGWLMFNAHDASPVWFGLELPRLIGPDDSLGERLEEIHETFGKIGYALIAAHAGAGLWHHYGRRDNALRRIGFGHLRARSP